MPSSRPSLGFLGIALVTFVGPLAAQLPPVPYPPENPFSEAKRVLGKVLFWDEQLSSDDTVACGTCHRPAAGGADPRAGTHPGPDGLFGTDDDVVGSPGVTRVDSLGIAVLDPLFGHGVQVTGRASQPVIGSQWGTDFFWDGRARSVFTDPQSGLVSIASGGGLESQVVGPPLSAVEMAQEGRTWADVASKLTTATPLALATNLPADVAAAIAGASYPDLFSTAFGTPAITPERIAYAVATYERTLVPDQTPYDLGTMTPQQDAGFLLLQDHTVCLNCHVPPLFTDNDFHNIGLRPADDDLGRFSVTGVMSDRGRFKTPTLRNAGLRSTQMHVGWITSVQDAIDFYNAPAFPMADPETGHTQHTTDQSGIPTGSPGVFANYQDIMMPAFFHANVVEFLSVGLTDPRVAAETFPFDRPTLASEQVVGVTFRRADVNDDTNVDISDPIYALSALFVPLAPQPPCADAADSNDDGQVDIGDVVFTLSFLFDPTSASPPNPGPVTCGEDPTADGLTCESYTLCP